MVWCYDWLEYLTMHVKRLIMYEIHGLTLKIIFHTLKYGRVVMLFLSLLEASVMAGDKMLVFSQSLYTLDLLERILRRLPLPDSYAEDSRRLTRRSDGQYTPGDYGISDTEEPGKIDFRVESSICKNKMSNSLWNTDDESRQNHLDDIDKKESKLDRKKNENVDQLDV
ncbi:unnamed protein product [Protopolystoma xenopodis]|uniref:Uncharacterized protein n=1 Tax=Protopolystoma xenopodis TaxID=117903 RepID=A0A3S5AH55_9PLAT|nr:unnamed protein product [Protopolystoma xenopodis]